MCGRFALTLPQDAVIEMFRATPKSRFTSAGASEALAAIDRPRWNIRPTETIGVIALEGGERVLRPMRWGFLPDWCKTTSDGPLLINARAESIAGKPAFRQACRESRFLIVADGFYEWRAEAGPGKEPYWIRPASGAPLVFAGVWRRWRSPVGLGDPVEIDSVAIVTCAANPRLSPIHHRLPVAIAPEHYGLWLGEDGRGAATLMRAPDDDFYAVHRVSTAINKGGRDALDCPELLAPVTEAELAAAKEEAAIGRLL